VLAGMAFLCIAKVDEAELSVTCTERFIGPDDELSICICLTKHLAVEGAVKTDVVSVVDKFIPAFLYCIVMIKSN
tara:strand:+ start:34 stop:258 length:225 start_codon:yes stop_codon:yes gene_type:complete